MATLQECLEGVVDKRTDVCLVETSFITDGAAKEMGTEAGAGILRYMYGKTLSEIRPSVLEGHIEFNRIFTKFLETQNIPILFTTGVCKEYQNFTEKFEEMYEAKKGWSFPSKKSRQNTAKKRKTLEKIQKVRRYLDSLEQSICDLRGLIRTKEVGLQGGYHRTKQKFIELVDCIVDEESLRPEDRNASPTDREVCAYGLFFACYVNRNTVILSDDKHVHNATRAVARYMRKNAGRTVEQVHIKRLNARRLLVKGLRGSSTNGNYELMTFFDSGDYSQKQAGQE